MPEEGAPLPRDGEVVHEALPRPDGALRHVRRPVRPPRPQLPNAVPVLFVRISRKSRSNVTGYQEIKFTSGW